MDFKTSNEENPQVETPMEAEKNSANKLVMSLLGVMVVFLLVMGVMIFKNMKGDALKTNIVDEKQQINQEQEPGTGVEAEEVAPLTQEEIDNLLNEPAAGENGDGAAVEEVAPLTQEEIDSLLNAPPAVAPEAATDMPTSENSATESAPAAAQEEVRPLTQQEIDALLNNPAP